MSADQPGTEVAEVVVTGPAFGNVRAGFTDANSFELSQRIGKALMQSKLVPAVFQNNLPDCIIALELAQRIGASPLMVMQNLNVIHGKPSWGAKFLIAAVNQCGRFEELQYEWGGEQGKDSWSCRAWTTSKKTGERVQGPMVTIAMAKAEGWYEKSGSKWKTIPELMLMYRAAGWFANTNAPEVTMGLPTSEEVRDIVDLNPAPTQPRPTGGQAPTTRAAMGLPPQGSEPAPVVEGTATVVPDDDVPI